jgi:hypothetical protein
VPWTSRQCPISKRGTTTRPTQEHHRIGLLFLTTTTKRRLALCSTDSYVGNNTRSGKELNVAAEVLCGQSPRSAVTTGHRINSLSRPSNEDLIFINDSTLWEVYAFARLYFMLPFF